jgi:hypothetical protein
MRFESKRGPRRRKEKTNMYGKLEILFFLLFFHYSFSFALKDVF